jgi:hypothetical protein
MELNESSWRTAFLVPADEEPVFGDEVFAVRLAAALVAKRKASAKKRHRAGKMPQFFFRCLTLSMLVFGRNLSSRGRRGDQATSHNVLIALSIQRDATSWVSSLTSFGMTRSGS